MKQSQADEQVESKETAEVSADAAVEEVSELGSSTLKTDSQKSTTLARLETLLLR